MANEALRGERSTFERSYSTAADFKTTAFFIGFLPSVRGLRILDIGAGASTAALELNKLGAETIVLDVRYRSLGELQDSVEKFLTDPKYSARAENEKRKESELQKLADEMPKSVNPSLWNLALQMTKATTNQGEQIYFALQRRQMQIFLEAVKRREIEAIASSAPHLPFKDRKFDVVYSLQALSQFLIEDRNIFMASINEAIRVLRPGGELRLHPWVYNPSQFRSQDIRRSGNALMTFLQQRRIPHRVERISPLNQPRLVITKRK